jgi:hypothetical protein
MAIKQPAIYDSEAISARVAQLRGEAPSGRTFFQMRGRDGGLLSYEEGDWEVAGTIEERRPSNWRMTQFVDGVIADLDAGKITREKALKLLPADAQHRALPKKGGALPWFVAEALRAMLEPNVFARRAGKSALSDEFKRQAVELGVMTATEVRTLEDVAAARGEGTITAEGMRAMMASIRDADSSFVFDASTLKYPTRFGGYSIEAIVEAAPAEARSAIREGVRSAMDACGCSLCRMARKAPAPKDGDRLSISLGPMPSSPADGFSPAAVMFSRRRSVEQGGRHRLRVCGLRQCVRACRGRRLRGSRGRRRGYAV